MNLTGELAKLAELHAQGHLTDEEFLQAKTRLLTDAPSQKSFAGTPPPPTLSAPPPPKPAPARAPAAAAEDRVFHSSRWSSGNFFFRDRVTAASDGIIFRKGALFGANEEHISYGAIASFKLDEGVFLANITVETAGGSQPVFINGLWKSDARVLQEIIRAYQARQRARL